MKSVYVLSIVVLLGVLGVTFGMKKAQSSSGSVLVAPTNEEFVRIGEVGTLSGMEASFGIATHKGIELAVDEVNAAGGIHGKRIQLISYDDQGKAEETAVVATKLIAEKKVHAILGAVGSSKSIAMAPIAQRFKIPMVCPDATNPKVTELGDYIFRACFTDPFQGKVMADFTSKNLQIKTVSVLYDIKSDYSVGLADHFVKTFTKNGGKVLTQQSYGAGDIDFRSQLTVIRSGKPEAIFIPGYYTEIGLIARQAKELGIETVLLGGDGWASPKLLEVGGSSVLGAYFSSSFAAENKSVETQKFVKNFKSKYGIEPDDLAALGYDAAALLLDAMKRAASMASADIRQALADTKSFQAVTGKIAMDANRNPLKSAVILKVGSEGFSYHSTLNP